MIRFLPPSVKYTLCLAFSMLIMSCFSGCAGEPPGDPDKEEWLSIFNGTSMESWTPKFTGQAAGVNYKNTFRVEDGLLRVRYDNWEEFNGEFGHLFYEKPFTHYRIRATYRFVDEQLAGSPGWAFRNNGLMLHCQTVESMALEQEFPLSIEVQLLGGRGEGARPTANLCTPGTHVHMSDSLFKPHCISSSSETYHGDQWVTVEVLVLGDSLIQHIVDDKVVLEYTRPVVDASGEGDSAPPGMTDGAAVSGGYISIQAETHPTDFKSIEVLDLCGCTDPKAKNYKSYYVKSDNSRCVY